MIKRDFNKSVGNPKTRNKSKTITSNKQESAGSPNAVSVKLRRPKKKMKRNQQDGLSLSSGSPNVKNEHSGSPMTKQKKGYLDTIADQEAKLISKNSLEEGEKFEQDIKDIMEKIDDVEKNMNH